MPLLIKNILRNRRRTALTALSIAGSFCMLGVLMAMYVMFFLAPVSTVQSLRLIVRNRISFTNPVPLSYESRIASVPGVREVMKYQWFGGTYKDSREMKNTFSRFAVDANKLFRVRPEYTISDEDRAAFLREKQACILGRPLAERLGLKRGDHVVLVGDIFPKTLDLVVRGFYDCRRDNENLYFHFDYLNEAVFKGQQNFVSMFAIIADRPEVVTGVAKNVDALFRNSTQQTKTESERSLELSFLSYVGNVKLFLIALSASLCLAILFMAANTMAMSVRERVAEVGILKTLGFQRSYILGLFIGEAVVIAVAGGVIGLGCAGFLITLLKKVPVMFVDLKALSISTELAAIAVVLAAVVGMMSSVVPAWTASRKGILECLKFMD